MSKIIETKIIPGLHDQILKRLIKSNRVLLELLITTCTHFTKEDMKHIVFQDTDLPKDNIKEKGKVADIVIGIKGNIINIEGTMSLNKSQFLKDYIYHHKLISNRFSVGEEITADYMYQIIISNKKFDDRIVINFTLWDDRGKYQDEENFQRVHVSVAKAMEMWYNKDKLSKFEKAIAMLGIDNTEELRKIAGEDKDLVDMAKTIEELNKEGKFIGLYDKEKMDKAIRDFDLKEAKEEGEKAGMKLGKQEKEREIAKNLISIKMPVEDISKVTGLSEEEINRLKD